MPTTLAEIYVLTSPFPLMSFPGGSDGKESACNARDPCSIPGLGRSPGERNGYPVQYSYLENSMNRRALGVIVHWVTESNTAEKLTLSLFQWYFSSPGDLALRWWGISVALFCLASLSFLLFISLTNSEHIGNTLGLNMLFSFLNNSNKFFTNMPDFPGCISFNCLPGKWLSFVHIVEHIFLFDSGL